MGRYKELIRAVGIFDTLDQKALDNLEAKLKKKLFFKDDVIVHQNNPGDAMYIIISGKVKVVLYGEGGREMILSIFRSGDFFGEMSLLDGKPRSASVISMEESHLLILERDAFMQHLETNPKSAIRILAVMSERLRKADEIIGNLALLDVYNRLGRLLYELGQREGHSADSTIVINKRPTHQELASMIGTSRETVSRVLAELQRQGAISLSGKTIVLRSHSFWQEPLL